MLIKSLRLHFSVICYSSVPAGGLTMDKSDGEAFYEAGWLGINMSRGSIVSS